MISVSFGICHLYYVERNIKDIKIDLLALQERQRVVYDEQKKLAQQQAQIKSQMARYEDELARKRMQACESSDIFLSSCLSCNLEMYNISQVVTGRK
mgnify:CR=1 FL=1